MIFPNPVTDELYIKNLQPTDKQFVIYSLEGKIVMKTIISNEKIFVGDLPKGIYTIKVGDRNSRFVKI
jgi:hypothetical protein